MASYSTSDVSDKKKGCHYQGNSDSRSYRYTTFVEMDGVVKSV
jgi:hypothetical protein